MLQTTSDGECDIMALYFEAALKVLHGASLLELSNAEKEKHGEIPQSTKLYADSARLCK